MKKLLLILSLCSSALLGSSVAVAQEIPSALDSNAFELPRPVTSVITLGLGQGRMRDTYLTNLMYEGPSVNITYERWRLMRKHQWNNEQILDLSYSKGEDKSRMTTAMAGRLQYLYAMHKVWRLGKPSQLTDESPFALFVGPYVGMNLGFNYNLKLASGNNPATLHLTNNLGVSAGAVWHYALRRQPCALQFQVQTPLLGMAVVPEYGASYYETFYVEENPNMIQFTSLSKQQDLNFRITTDIPLSTLPFLKKLDTTFRFGFAYHIETMDVNDIVTRYSTCEFVLGWTYQYLPVSRRKAHLLKSRPAYAY